MVLLDVTASRCWQTLTLTGLADREAGDQKPIDAYAEVGLALGSCGISGEVPGASPVADCLPSR